MIEKSTTADFLPSMLVLLAVLGYLLAGCAPTAAPVFPLVETEPAESPGLEPTLRLDTEIDPPTPAEPVPDPMLATPIVVQPTVRQELYASDPSEFRLAAGEIQFIEFFAFW